MQREVCAMQNQILYLSAKLSALSQRNLRDFGLQNVLPAALLAPHSRTVHPALASATPPQLTPANILVIYNEMDPARFDLIDPR